MKDLATAYAVKKKAKKMAKGGKVESDMDHGSKRGPEGYSKYQEQAQNQKGVHTPVSGVTQFPGGKGTSRAGDLAKDRYAGKAILNEHAKEEHHKVLHEMRSMPKPRLMAEGGDVESDLVSKIIQDHMYSKGGMVANDVGVAEADEMPAEYDDLVLRDDLEMSYDGANSGDELGNEQMDHDDADIVAKILRSKAKRDRMPRPA